MGPGSSGAGLSAGRARSPVDIRADFQDAAITFARESAWSRTPDLDRPTVGQDRRGRSITDDLLTLQSHLGNRAVLRVLAGAGAPSRKRDPRNRQADAVGPVLQRRAKNCPAAPPSPPTIKTMADFIALVERVETDAGTKNDPIATARLIARTKYEGEAWDWMLPSTSGKAGVEQTSRGGWVTVDDIASLCFKLVVSTPDGPMDPMHIIVAIVADAETLPAGTGAGFKASHFAAPLPASVSQRAASTWVGDVGKAAAEWMTVYPLAEHPTKADYMLANAPPHDLLANVEGVAMTSKSPASGFALDTKAPLSANLRLFLRSGREMRFHVFVVPKGSRCNQMESR
jgi:hypothetical protein